MLCFINGDIVSGKSTSNILFKAEGTRICLLEFNEINKLDDSLVFKQNLLDGENMEDCTSKYENHDGYDMMHINVPEGLKDKNSVRALGVYITKDVFVCTYSLWDVSDNIVDIITGNIVRNVHHQRILLNLLDLITKNDYATLGKIEDEVSEMEEFLTNHDIKDLINEISSLRRKLQPLKRFYEQLLDSLEDFEEDSNDIFSEADLRYCKRIKNRVDRLYHTVINLRDYVTQVREAYQSQIDIGLNNIMKVFTVITTIFLPLTLLVGWYGMNLKIPEFSWDYGYLYVIVLSVIIVVGCIIFFKKKKWF